MVDRIDTILMWVKFGDYPISSLDFSFIGGVYLNINATMILLSQVCLLNVFEQLNKVDLPNNIFLYPARRESDG